jgi:recombination protein RecA
MTRVNKHKEISYGNLDDLISKLNKEINSEVTKKDLTFISTGNLALNYIISGKFFDGGFPIGKITEIYGSEATGKSLLALNALVETQKRGGVAVLIDSEYSFNNNFFRSLGGDLNKLIVYQPTSVEDSYEFIEKIVSKVREFNKDILITIVYDSIAATPTKFELENDLDKADYGKRAQIHSKAMRKMAGFLSTNNVTFIAINQVRHTMCLAGNSEILVRF